MNSTKKKIVKIANGQGFWGDSLSAPVDLIDSADIDYLTLDYLAEVTLSIMQKQKNKNSDLGYAHDFIKLIELKINEIVDKKIKIITNASGVNPVKCSELIKKIAKKNNKNINVAIVSGDDIFQDLGALINNNIKLKNMDTNEPINDIYENICSANVYINSFTISEALDLGADIVLCGRVSDPGLCLGPMIHEFGWRNDNYNKLASGTLAGHIIECGAQCTGGNHTDWKNVPNLASIGYPIIEVYEDGNFNITKHKDSGGLINKFTVSEQILYEMGDPRKYISPDVCVDFTSFNICDNGDNTVSISDVVGMPPTDTYKVSISYFNGYKSIGQLTVSGPNALDKAKLVSEIIWKRLKNKGYTYNSTNTEFLGTTKINSNDNSSNDISEVILRLSVKDKCLNKVNAFGEEIAPVITNGPPGITGFSGGRPKAQQIISFWPALIPKKLVKTKVVMI